MVVMFMKTALAKFCKQKRDILEMTTGVGYLNVRGTDCSEAMLKDINDFFNSCDNHND